MRATSPGFIVTVSRVVKSNPAAPLVLYAGNGSDLSNRLILIGLDMVFFGALFILFLLGLFDFFECLL